MDPTPRLSPPRRPAARARWATSGLTAVVAVGAVAAMADAAADERRAERGHAYGTVAGHAADPVAASLMAAADDGGPSPPESGSPERPARLGVADVS